MDRKHEHVISTFEGLNFESLVVSVKEDPLAAINVCSEVFSRLDQGYHRHRYQLAATVVGFALQAKDLPRIQQRFLASDFWAKRKKKPQAKNILRLSFQYALQAQHGPAYERACNYAVAFQDYYEREISPEKIPALIEEDGGIEELYRVAVERRRGITEGHNLQENGGKISEEAPPSRQPNPGRSAPKHADLHDTKSEELEENDDDHRATREGASSGGRDQRVVIPRRRVPRFDPTKHLLIGARPDQLETALRVGLFDKARVTFECRGKLENFGFKDLVATSVELLDDV